MTTEDFIIELYCRVDDELGDVNKHSQAKLHPNEVVTFALLLTLNGGSNREYHRRVERNYRYPEQDRLVHLSIARFSYKLALKVFYVSLIVAMKC